MSVEVNADPFTEYVYGDVPPVTAPSVIDPLAAPQVALTIVFTILVMAAGSVIVTFTVVVHPLASVTVNTCAPAFNPVCDGVIVYGPTPPAAVITTDPVDPPLHATLVCVNVALNTGGSVIVTFTVFVHPLASVTVNTCAPAFNPVCDGVMV